jgi:glucuronoarabinoxylan endo-1,4-beta-xylanase
LYPTYISIQNEPDYLATWESCLFHFFERVNATDTIAGYNKALEIVHNKISERNDVPKFLGPESIGLGYDALRRYLLHADTSLLDGVAFHLYHGVNPQNPWAANEFKSAAEHAPEIPYFQTEYEGGGWFNTAGLIYNALVDANVVSYFYWDLIWENGGLVSLEFPWDRNQWSNTKGYTKTKEFYAFKQFSAFVHSGWQRIEAELVSNMLSTVAFSNPGGDTTSVVVINRSSADEFEVALNFEDFEYTESKVYHTSLDSDCEDVGGLIDSKLTVPVQSITTIELVNNGGTNKINEIEKNIDHSIIYPNPFNQDATLIHSLNKNEKLTFTVFDINGKTVHCEKINGGSNKNSITIYRKDLRSGLYFYILEDNYGNHNKGKLHIID